MYCIFCKQNSKNSKSKEHIFPESLLPKSETTLPPGLVCDKCNNYFSRKIEKPLLNSPYFRFIRFRESISSKRNRIPSIQGFDETSKIAVDECHCPKKKRITVPSISSEKDKSLVSIIRKKKGKYATLYEIPEYPEKRLMARFLGKVALEILALISFNRSEKTYEEGMFVSEFDKLRDFTRYNKHRGDWQFHMRKMHNENAILKMKNGGYARVLQHHDFLYTDAEELYSVLMLFGVEYVINYENPDITGYQVWLNDNKQMSPICSRMYKTDNIEPLYMPNSKAANITPPFNIGDESIIMDERP